MRSYGVLLVIAFLVTLAVRRFESRRLGYLASAGYRWVGVGALVGAVVGSKLGMVLFEPPAHYGELLERMMALDFTGKTVVGGLAGGYLGVEVSKKLVGIRHSTGDGFAVALPLGQAIGRIGCFLDGCCYGRPTTGLLAVTLGGEPRHPVQLYEAALDLLLAVALWSMRNTVRPAGHLFRRYLIGYSAIRFGMEFLRGDPALHLGPLTLVQLACVATILGFGWLVVRAEWKLHGAVRPA